MSAANLSLGKGRRSSNDSVDLDDFQFSGGRRIRLCPNMTMACPHCNRQPPASAVVDEASKRFGCGSCVDKHLEALRLAGAAELAYRGTILGQDRYSLAVLGERAAHQYAASPRSVHHHAAPLQSTPPQHSIASQSTGQLQIGAPQHTSSALPPTSESDASPAEQHPPVPGPTESALVGHPAIQGSTLLHFGTPASSHPASTAVQSQPSGQGSLPIGLPSVHSGSPSGQSQASLHITGSTQWMHVNNYQHFQPPLAPFPPQQQPVFVHHHGNSKHGLSVSGTILTSLRTDYSISSVPSALYTDNHDGNLESGESGIYPPRATLTNSVLLASQSRMVTKVSKVTCNSISY